MRWSAPVLGPVDGVADRGPLAELRGHPLAVEYAAAAGVTTIVEPGGSARAGEVAASAAAHGIAHVQTGLRLFHH